MQSKFDWAKIGDANSKLFHLSMSARKVRNCLWNLDKSNGVVTKVESEIVEEVSSSIFFFFRNLFTSQRCTVGDWENIHWSPIFRMGAGCLEKRFEEGRLKGHCLHVMEINPLCGCLYISF